MQLVYVEVTTLTLTNSGVAIFKEVIILFTYLLNVDYIPFRCILPNGYSKQARIFVYDPCPANQVCCRSGECVSGDKICNSQIDCKDGSDESEQFCCKSDMCLSFQILIFTIYLLHSFCALFQSPEPYNQIKYIIIPDWKCPGDADR